MTNEFIIEKIRYLLPEGAIEKIVEEVGVSRTTVFNVFRGVHGNDRVIAAALYILEARKEAIEAFVHIARERGLDKQGKGRKHEK